MAVPPIENDPLADLPVESGFRMRGLGMTRTETFTDAAFAFAATLLVISIDAIPTSYDDLIGLVGGIPAFALAFALLMLFWWGHWTWSRRYGLEDGTAVVLSCLLVLILLCYVYPLKFMSNGLASWITGGRVASGLKPMTWSQLHRSFIVYGVGFVAMSLIIVFLNLHAYRRRRDLGLNALECFDTWAQICSWLILVGAGVLSITLALVAPPSRWVLPGLAYMSLCVVMPLFGIVTGRRRERYLAKTPG